MRISALRYRLGAPFLGVLLAGCSTMPPWVAEPYSATFVSACSISSPETIARNAALGFENRVRVSQRAIQINDRHEEHTLYSRKVAVNYRIVDTWQGSIEGQDNTCVLVEMLP
jgi:hypothetical protein